MNQAPVPPYFDELVQAYHQGEVGRFVHLGCWDVPTVSFQPSSENESLAQAQHRLNRLVVDELEIQPGQSILDVGCGFGGTLASLNERSARLHLTGVNIDERQLAICRTIEPKQSHRLEWIQADACALPWQHAHFDHLLCVEAMFHFGSRETFFREAARVIRPGGQMVVTDMLVDLPPHQELPWFAVHALLNDGYGPWPELRTTLLEWESSARRHGWQIIRRVDLTRQTLPSYDYLLPHDLDETVVADHPGLRAAQMLRWLHQREWLRYWCLSLRACSAESRAATCV